MARGIVGSRSKYVNTNKAKGLLRSGSPFVIRAITIQTVMLLKLETINPLKPNSPNCYTLTCKTNLTFFISDIRALWSSALSAKVPECQKLKMVG